MKFGLGLGWQGGEPAPFDDANVALWLRGDSYDAGTGTWEDLSGNSRDFTQANASNRPAAGTVSSQPAVVFDGVDNFVEYTSWPNLAAAECFIVTQLDADPPTHGNSGLWRFGGDNNLGYVDFYPYGDSFIYEGWGSSLRKDALAVNPAPTLTLPRVYSIRTASGAWSLHLDGNQLASTATNTVAWQTHVSLGTTNPLGTAHTYWLKGKIAEYIVISGGCTAPQRASILNYLSARYGILVGFFPSTLGNLTLTLDARQVVLNGSDVSQWTDLSQPSLSPVQASAALQPAYIANDGDGAPAVSFGGTGDPNYLARAGAMPIDADADYTQVVLINPLNAGGYSFVLSRSDQAADWCGISTGGSFAYGKLYDGTNDNEWSTSAPSGSWHMITHRRTGTTGKIKSDGNADATLTLTSVNVDPNTLTVGALNFGGSYLLPFAGKLRLVLTYSNHLSDAALASLRTWIQGQFPGVP